MKKLTITALALTVLATTPALAQTYRTRAQTAMANETATTWGRTNNNAGYEAYAFVPGSNFGPQPGVYADGEYRGWDPDPFIRLQLLRENPDSDGE